MTSNGLRAKVDSFHRSERGVWAPYSVRATQLPSGSMPLPVANRVWWGVWRNTPQNKER